jgi:hypothetical protein
VQIFLTKSRLNFQLMGCCSFLHCFSLTIFTCISQCYLLGSLGSSLKLWKFLTTIPFFVFCVSACAFCNLSVLTFLIDSNYLHCMSFASRAKLAQLFYHFHNRQILSRGNLRTSKNILHDMSAGIIDFNMYFFVSIHIYIYTISAWEGILLII